MQNEMRDRLVDLIKQAKQNTKNANCDLERNMLFADSLIENGVVVLDTDVLLSEYRPLIRTIADMPLNEVIELIKAKREGRIIVTPCKVGDTVYVITIKRPCYACILCTDYCHRNCSFDDKNKLVVKTARVSAIEYETQGKFCVEIDRSKICNSYNYTYWFADFGKTVFLTKEEAEKALKEGVDN